MIDVDRMVGGLGQLVQDADLASGDGCGREDRGAEQLLADRLRTGESEEEPSAFDLRQRPGIDRKLAAAAVTVSGGQVMTNLYLINLASGDPVSLVNQGGVPQWLGWTSASTILAVYDTRAVLYNAGGGERAVYDFAGTELKDVSVDAAGNVALLLASGQVSQAVTLDKNLNVQFSAAVSAANSIVRAGNLFYLLADNAVECFDASGTQQWSQNLDTSPQALLANSKDLLLFSGNTVQKLEIPAQGS